MDTIGPRIACRCVVTGRVQGVFYRASAAEQARALDISGYVRNLADGRVEVLALGPEESLRRFIDWLRVGPAAAKVADVSVEPLDAATLDLPMGFGTG